MLNIKLISISFIPIEYEKTHFNLIGKPIFYMPLCPGTKANSSSDFRTDNDGRWL